MTKVWLAAGAALVFSASLRAQSPPEIPYESVPNFFKLPENTYFGEVSALR